MFIYVPALDRVKIMRFEESSLYPPNLPGTIVQTNKNINHIVDQKDGPRLTIDRMGAVLSEDGDYRYYIWMVWDDEKRPLPWICCNPSYADGIESDATMDSIAHYSGKEGYGSCVVANIWAYQNRYPGELQDVDDPVGPLNDQFLQHMADNADEIVAGWGSIGPNNERPQAIAKRFNVDWLAVQSGNVPYHPNRQKNEYSPTPWEP
jgi:hypothetical protein